MGEQIVTMDGTCEMAFYFSPKVFMPDPKRMRRIGRALIFNGDIIGMCDSRLNHGELRVYFNPMVQKIANYDAAERKIMKVIRESRVKTLED